MLKKRILASSMASVMALSSVSVVAFAEDKDYGEAVNKAELKEYIASFEKFIEQDLEKYGSTQAERFLAAIDHGNNVLADAKSTDEDYTAAYQMIKAVYDRRVIKTSDDLKGLMKDNEAIYEQNNILNEYFQDRIYKDDKYTAFHDAYDTAEGYVGSEDSRGITDAWIALNDAVNNLQFKDKVSKSEFRAALQEYEKLELQMKEKETWRRGVLSVNPTTGSIGKDAKGNDMKKLLVDKSCIVTMAGLIDLVYVSGASDYNYWNGATLTSVKNKNGIDPADSWIGKGVDASDGLKAGIKAQSDLLANAKGVVETSDEAIVAAYKACKDAVAVFKGWKADTLTTGSQSKASTLEANYHPQLVEVFANADIATAVGNVNTKLGATVAKYDEGAHKITSTKAFAIIVNKTTKMWVTGMNVYADATEAKAAVAAKAAALGVTADKLDVQTIAAGTNLMTYMPYTVNMTTINTNLADLVAKETAYDTALDNDNKARDEWADAVKAFNDKLATLDAELKPGVELKTSKKFTADKDVYSLTADKDYFEAQKNTTAYNALQTQAEKDAADAQITAYNAVITALDTLNTTAKGKYDVVMTTTTGTKDLLTTAETNLATAQGTAGMTDSKYYDLAVAVDLYNKYKAITWKDANGKDIPGAADAGKALIDALANGKKIVSYANSPAEWTIVWRNLAYAIDDAFHKGSSSNVTLPMLLSMTEKAYDVAELVGDASLFASKYNALVAQRQYANDWYKQGKAMGAAFKAGETVIYGEKVADVYNDLKGLVDDLNKFYADFKYSYGKISDDIAEVAAKIDSGDITATDDLKKWLSQAAYDLSVLEPSAPTGDITADSNLAFDSERTFQPVNRLKTAWTAPGVGEPNSFEKNLKKSYEALMAAYEAATKGTTGEGFDLTGDGTVDFEDLQVLFDEYVMKGNNDAKYDVNGDGLVDFEDIQIVFEKQVMA